MKLNNTYFFKSERLGFRNWMDSDLDEFAKLNSDLEVMEHFPKTLTKEETEKFIKRLKAHYTENGYSYFAIEILNTGEFIGFIGLAFKDYKSDFTPAVDIGWRLKKSAWGKGFATEGAKKCLELAFNELNLDKVISTCTERNYKSENVMKKIGMKKVGEFKHPQLKDYPDYEKCLCYEIRKTTANN